MLRYDFYRSSGLLSNGKTANVLLHGFDLDFKVKQIKWPFWQVNVGKLETLQLSSDRKSRICNQIAPLRVFCIKTLTYIFKVTKFEMWLGSSKMMKVSKKCSSMTFIEVDIYHRMEPLRKLYSTILI